MIGILFFIAILVMNFQSGEKNTDILAEQKESEVLTPAPSVEEPAPLPEEEPVAEVFAPAFAYSAVSEEVEKRITNVSWKEGCPVPIEELRYLQVAYWGFDDQPHMGELIVNKAVAEEVAEIFQELYEAKFPIEKIRLIDEYGAEDKKSMADNNTSSFCYREVEGKPGKLSKHSYGLAIDLNPVQNPYVYKEEISPEAGKDYTDRSETQKGMILKGDVCYQAFIDRGWTWGGDWNYEKDYQHFQKSIK